MYVAFILLALLLGANLWQPTSFKTTKNFENSPSMREIAPQANCQPKLEMNEKVQIDIDSDKEIFPDGSPLYIEKEAKEWVLIKRKASIPAWKVFGGFGKCRFDDPEREIPDSVPKKQRAQYCQNNDGTWIGEMEKIGTTIGDQKDVYIGLGHCNGIPGKTCLDPLVQDAIFVVDTKGLEPPLPDWARWKKPDEDPTREGYWWLFDVYLDKSLLPDSATDDDLPCWTKLACAGDIIVDGKKRRQQMMEEYQRTGVCPVGLNPNVSSLSNEIATAKSSSEEKSNNNNPRWQAFSFSALAPTGTRSLQLGTFVLTSTKFNYEWWTPACKPALYLYPEKPTSIFIKVKPEGKITDSIPHHGRDGWQVLATPNGEIYPLSTNKQPLTANNSYPYLYYEARLDKVKVPKNEGWIVRKDNLEKFFNKILLKLGLNKKETDDFLNYWIKKLSYGDKWFIGLIDTDELNRVEPIYFSVKPDTFIRLRFYFEQLKKESDKLNISTPNISLYQKQRQGFTVIDWGGILANGSCGISETSQ